MAPTTEELTESIRKELQQRLADAQSAKDSGKLFPDGASPSAAQRDLDRFEKILKEVPKGFRLVPVLYSRIDRDAKEQLTKEYSFHVRPKFMKFLAENHADELKKLGICDGGIQRMKNGLDPADDNGELYSVNVDHIIERNGSGLWGASKSKDADRPGEKATFNPNHFGNFILLPEKIHEFKNQLNDVQHASETPHGQSKWILMMAPERNALQSGFVCPPQDPSHRLAGLDLRAGDDFKRIEHGEFIVKGALEQVSEFKDMDGVRETVRGLIAEADKEKLTVADLAALQAEGKKKGDLRKAFSDAVAKTPEVQAQLDNIVKPALGDVAAHTQKMFNRLSARLDTGKQRAAFWKFARYVRSRDMRDLEQDVEALPFQEAKDFRQTMRDLSKEVTKVCDRLDADAKARRALQPHEGMPDFRPAPEQDNKPQMVPLPQQKKKGKPIPPEGRPKRTFGRPGHFKPGQSK